MKILKEYSFALINPKLASTAVTVAIVVGSILFTINHGHALIKGKMTRDRVAPRFARPRRDLLRGARSISLRLTTKCLALRDHEVPGFARSLVSRVIDLYCSLYGKCSWSVYQSSQK